jgi:hypothetical protein
LRDFRRPSIFDFFDSIGQFRKSDSVWARSVHASTVDMRQLHQHVGFVPGPDTSQARYCHPRLLGIAQSLDSVNSC